MRSNNKKAALREKLKSNFEWTTEAIENFNVNGLLIQQAKTPSPIAANQLPPPDFMTKNEIKKDTMEEKIERVQVRKKEAADRAIRLLKNPNPINAIRINNSLKEYQESVQKNGKNYDTTEIASKLNKYFLDLLGGEKQNSTSTSTSSIPCSASSVRNKSFSSTFPLHFFDVSTYDEVLLPPEWYQEIVKNGSHSKGNTTVNSNLKNSNDSNENKNIISKNYAGKNDRINSTIDKIDRNDRKYSTITNSKNDKNKYENNINRQYGVCLLSPSQLLLLNEDDYFRGRHPEVLSSDSESEERNMCIGRWFPCHIIGPGNVPLGNVPGGEEGEDEEKYWGGGNNEGKGKNKDNSGPRQRTGSVHEIDTSTNMTKISLLLNNENNENYTEFGQEEMKGNENNYSSPNYEFIVPSMQIYFPTQSLQLYSERVTDALVRRRDCMALNKYHFFVRNMPYDSVIASSLSSEQADRIRIKCMR